MNAWRATWIVFAKELRDALRDRRTLMVVLVTSVAMGPLVLVLEGALQVDVAGDLRFENVTFTEGSSGPAAKKKR